MGVNGEAVVIDTDLGTAEIPFHSLNKAKLVLTDKLIKETAKGLNKEVNDGTAASR